MKISFFVVPSALLILVSVSWSQSIPQGITPSKTGASTISQGGTSTGTVTGTYPFHNVFGWKIGSVKIQFEEDCSNPCKCQFAGSPSLSESLPVQSCTIESVQIFRISCGSNSSCPNGKNMGEKAVITYMCCVSAGVFGDWICDTYTDTLVSCS